jgi:hypothetical protein
MAGRAKAEGISKTTGHQSMNTSRAVPDRSTQPNDGVLLVL